MLRRAHKSDAPAIAKVHVDTWKSTYKGIVPDEYLSKLCYDKREQMWKETLSQPERNSHVWVVTDADEKVIGFSSGGKNRDTLLPFDGEVYAIYLQQAEQKKGQGIKLFLESLEQLYRDGFYRMVLWVLEDNPTRQFYEAMGGRPVAEKWEEIGGKRLKEIAYGWDDIFATLKNKVLGFRHPNIKHYSALQEKDVSRYQGSDELLSIGAPFARHLGLTHLGIHHELLLPGRRTSWPHAEQDEDEFVYVIDGNPDVWLDGHLYRLNPGDGIAFPSGTGLAHTCMNNTLRDVRLLVVGEATKKTNKIFYPLHPKRNEELGDAFWNHHPTRLLGNHDGLPSMLRPKIPTLLTDRLLLRPISAEDAPAIFAYAQNPNVSRYTLWEPHQSLRDTEAFIHDYILSNYDEGMPEPLGVCLKGDGGKLIGTVGCFWVDKSAKYMELAYAYAEDYWGQGIAVEAARAILDYCFKEPGAQRIQARCKKENSASSRVMQKLGMKYEGTLRSAVYHREKFWDMDYYALLRSDIQHV